MEHVGQHGRDCRICVGINKRNEVPCEDCTPDGVFVELCKLHASAPALLEALEKIELEARMHGTSSSLCTLPERILATARAAIEAAKEKEA